MAHETLEAVRQIETEATVIQKNYEVKLEQDRIEQERQIKMQDDKFEEQLQKELAYIEKDLEADEAKAQERLETTIQEYQQKSQQALNQKRSQFVEYIVNEVSRRFTRK